MSSLHEVIYQIVLNPQILANLAQNSQAFMEQFNLYPSEVAALKSIPADQAALQLFLSPESLKRAVLDTGLYAWIPPNP
jgi:hypothetical protein